MFKDYIQVLGKPGCRTLHKKIVRFCSGRCVGNSSESCCQPVLRWRKAKILCPAEINHSGILLPPEGDENCESIRGKRLCRPETQRGFFMSVKSCRCGEMTETNADLEGADCT